MEKAGGRRQEAEGRRHRGKPDEKFYHHA